MGKRIHLASKKNLLVLMLFVSVLVGCTVGETANQENVQVGIPQTHKAAILPTTTPTPIAQILPTRTLDLYRPDTVRATYAAEATQKADEPTDTPKPSSTPTLTPEQLCQPFPDDIQYIGSTQILGYPAWTLQADCSGERTYFRSPVGDMTLFDYTTLTGRFAYGPSDANQSGLWVYDYWIELSEKWLDTQVIKAEWAPVRNREGLQLLVTLATDGTLSVSSGPFQTNPIASEITHFSIAPDGERIAYVKGDILYVIPIQGGQPRKLAEGAKGTPLWTLEGNAIILPSSPIKITYLDGSNTFVPELRSWIKKRVGLLCDGRGNCAFASGYVIGQFLWDEQSRLLVFYSNQQSDEKISRTIYVFELSEDLHWIENIQSFYGDFSKQMHWDILGESIIDPSGNRIEIGLPAESFSAEARILSIEDSTLMVEFIRNTQRSLFIAQHLTRIHIDTHTQVIDSSGYRTDLGDVKPGMIIKFTARKLAPYTLSMFAYTIQITCDQEPCNLGIAGRS
jgi:hypothetical protein